MELPVERREVWVCFNSKQYTKVKTNLQGGGGGLKKQSFYEQSPPPPLQKGQTWITTENRTTKEK